MTDPRVPTELPDVDQRILGRSESFFAADLAAFDDQLLESVSGARLLIVGGAGTIGSSTLRTLLRYRPALVDVIDHNENGLAELVRSLRSTDELGPLPEMQFLPFDVGGDPFRLWLAASDVPYDMVLNFSALKHVRSEKDPFSVLAMLQTNVMHLDRLSRLMADRSNIRRVFSVSTDKAANPSSMMGATKRLMEHALFLPAQPWSPRTAVTSARFANVAFSNGSLLQAWQYRLAAGQALAVPAETRRFFVAIAESGHLCTLAALCGTDRTITVPALDPSEHLVLLTDVVAAFLDSVGYEPWFTEDQSEAIGRLSELVPERRWPVLVTPLDTGGEKPYEEFVGVHEQIRDSSFASLREVEYVVPPDPNTFAELLHRLEAVLGGHDASALTIGSLRQMIGSVEPDFLQTHRASTKSLDQRM